MAGIFGQDAYRAYKKDMDKVVSEQRHAQLMQIDANYVHWFERLANAKSLEETLIYRLEQVDELIENNAANERNIDTIFKRLKFDFQKYGLVKYDAFQEMGGKLSFTLALLNEKNDGFVLNAVHSRDGCYTYVKEIIDGHSIIALAEEEEQALEQALSNTK